MIRHILRRRISHSLLLFQSFIDQRRKYFPMTLDQFYGHILLVSNSKYFFHVCLCLRQFLKRLEYQSEIFFLHQVFAHQFHEAEADLKQNRDFVDEKKVEYFYRYFEIQIARKEANEPLEDDQTGLEFISFEVAVKLRMFGFEDL